MAIATEQNEKSGNLMRPSRRQCDVSSLATQLAKLMAWARAMSLKQPLTDAQADVHMEEWALVAQEVGFDALSEAVRHVMRNGTDWFPSVKAIRDRAGINRERQGDAEARLMWDKLVRFVDRHVCSDVWGNYAIRDGCQIAVPQRVLDIVRRTGGWQVYKCMRSKDFPFIQKRFFEEFAACDAVEQIAFRPALAEGAQHQLAAKGLQ